MRASTSIISFASSGFKLTFGRQRRSRLLSSCNLALLRSGSSSEDEVFVSEDNHIDIDDQYVWQNLKHARDYECLFEERCLQLYFDLNDNRNDTKNLGTAQSNNELGRMRVVLESCGWVLGSPENYERISLNEYIIVRILDDLFDKTGDAALALSFFRWLEWYMGSESTIRSTCTMTHILVAGNMKLQSC